MSRDWEIANRRTLTRPNISVPHPFDMLLSKGWESRNPYPGAQLLFELLCDTAFAGDITAPPVFG